MNLNQTESTQARQVAIAAFLKSRMHSGDHGAIMPMPPGAPIPLSFGQERLWVLDKMGAGAAYNISVTLHLDGALDSAAFEAALQTMVQRHQILRMRFSDSGGAIRQRPDDEQPFTLDHIDLSNLDDRARQAHLAQLVQQDIETPFDLAMGPLFRARLLRLSEHAHVLLLAIHHIVWDGWSGGVFGQELGALYGAFAAGQPSPLSPMPIQFSDFAAWQRAHLSATAMSGQLDYWRRELAAAPTLLNLPLDYARPPVQTYNGALMPFAVPQSTLDGLVAIGRQTQTTLFMILSAAFHVLLARYSGQSDICIGTPVANRTRSDTEGLIGFFVNTLVLRTQAPGNPTFTNLLRQVGATVLGAYGNQDLPFEQVVDAVKPERHLSHAPLFQVMFVMQSSPLGSLALPGLQLRLETVDSKAAKVDLTLTVMEEGGKLAASFHYNTDLFKPTTVERMAGHFKRLLAAIVADPQCPIHDLAMLGTVERTRLVNEWNDTAVAYQQGITLHQMFEQRALGNPHGPALLVDDTSYTYAELNARANQLAHYLRAKGVGPDVLVGIAAERSLEMVVGLLATLKAGGAYVPLEPSYPQDRLAYMLADARPAVLLTQRHLLERWPGAAIPTFCIDSEWNALANYPTTNPAPLARTANLAYVIYTSGSTGRPKGVAIDHAGIVNRLQWMQEAYALDASDRVLQKTPYSFDVSVWEFFWPLAYGAQLVMARPGGHQDAAYLAGLINSAGITTMHFVPPMLDVFLNAADLGQRASLRQVMCSGQALPLELQQRFLARLPGVELHNLYGPTEASVDVTYWHCVANATLGCVPIGRPIANIQIHILDPYLNPVPAGVAGQLYIAGVGLARAYLNRPDLTAEKFIPNPFSHGAGSRMYQSGDLARYLADGSIEYLGRIDDQVKVRGFRIELGEIENALGCLDGVRDAVVLAREDVPGDVRLVAYLVGDGLTQDAVGPLRAALMSSLPDYMVPAHFLVLPALPLTSNGKVDRKALPAPDLRAAQSAYVAPTSDVESQLAAMWGSLLKLDRVGMHDNFFELGGNSLMVVTLHAQICAAFGNRLAVVDLFKYPSIDKLARFLDQADGASADHQPDSMARGEQRRQRALGANRRQALRSSK